MFSFAFILMEPDPSVFVEFSMALFSFSHLNKLENFLCYLFWAMCPCLMAFRAALASIIDQRSLLIFLVSFRCVENAEHPRLSKEALTLLIYARNREMLSWKNALLLNFFCSLWLICVNGEMRLLSRQFLRNCRSATLLSIFTLIFSSKMISLHVSPPYGEMIIDLRHLWLISFDLVTREFIVKTILRQHFKSQPGSIIKTSWMLDSIRD